MNKSLIKKYNSVAAFHISEWKASTELELGFKSVEFIQL